ncbi:MAG: replication initiation factor domain-containing protein [Thiomonas sp.]|uniref:replication initiation factor domain-containing protein n=1 Tax=Thiomonas sp. TaxID=2047785 RepID=UPI002A36505A|nr:replication initiation factor domain-containing protein [Thiomonas sp.]MDY0331829.1 replication initiation factor domain-containing protein [Thiomonas sp.]
MKNHSVTRLSVVPPDHALHVQAPLFAAPRTCNTGALIPKAFGVELNSFKIDWLEMTVQDCLWEDFVVKYLGLSPDVFTEQDFGRHGYVNLRTYGNVQLCSTDTKPERGTKVILPASALDEVARDSCEIIRLGFSDGASFARIDIAYDDYSGTLTFDRLKQHIYSDELVTRFRTVEEKCPRWLSGDKKYQPSGEGFVFGSSASSRTCVIYNKKLEQEYRAIKANQPLPETPDGARWWRVECRWHKQAALVLAEEIALHGLKNAGSVIRGVIDFRDPDTDNRTTRREISSWWARLMSTGEIIRTGIQKPITTITRKLQWLMRSCRKAIGQVGVILGERVINEIMQQGALETTQEEWSMLRSTYKPPQRVGFTDFQPEWAPF